MFPDSISLRIGDLKIPVHQEENSRLSQVTGDFSCSMEAWHHECKTLSIKMCKILAPSASYNYLPIPCPQLPRQTAQHGKKSQANDTRFDV